MASKNKFTVLNKQICAVTNLSIAANISLSALKIAVGLLGKSMALVADGIHSISDMATDVAVLIGVHFGSKEPDKRHPYGHGRVETFTAGFIALVLMLVGAAMIRHAGLDIARARVRKLELSVFIVALASVVSKELIYRITKKVALESHSTALYANAWHHRSDALSSVVVLAGFLSSRLGFAYGDQIAAIGGGFMIIRVGIRVLGDCVTDFSESAVDAQTIQKITDIIQNETRIKGWHKLRTRMVGREIFLDVHVLVDADLSITAAHEISDNFETALHNQLTRPVNITVHVEPDIEEMRK